MSHPQEMEAMDAELADMAILEIDEISMVDRIVLAYVHLRLQEWRRTRYHDRLCGHGPCRCGARMSFGGVKVVLAGDFGQLPPVAVAKEKTLLCPDVLRAGQDQSVGNLGLRLFRQIRAVFRLRRIHRQTGQSHYKDSLLRLRDAAHTKEDVDLWRTHDLSSAACELSVQERQDLSKTAVHLFCENRRAGEFNGRSLGEALLTPSVAGRALRIWSQDSSLAVERHAHDQYGGLRRVLHLAEGVPVMLLSNLRTVWNLVNGLRGRVVAMISLAACITAPGLRGFSAGSLEEQSRVRNADEVEGVSASEVQYVVVDFPDYRGPVMVAGHPTWVCVGKQQVRHERYRAHSRTQFPLTLCYGMTAHKAQGLTLHTGVVFDFTHEATWRPLECLGLAFVAMSRVTDFTRMAFRHVPDYWSFRAVAETDLFRWRAQLEDKLDKLHDLTVERHTGRCATVDDDVQAHVQWSEAKLGTVLTAEMVSDLRQMLAVRGLLVAPSYDDKPKRTVASLLGGGRRQRKVMRGAGIQSEAAEFHNYSGEESPVDPYEVDPETEAMREEFLYQLHLAKQGPPDFDPETYRQMLEEAHADESPVNPDATDSETEAMREEVLRELRRAQFGLGASDPET